MKENKSKQHRNKKRMIGIFGRIIFLCFCSILIGLRLYSWNVSTLMRDSMPMPFGYGVAVILSGSMEPELSVDDVVVVKKSDSYHKGDVVVYQSGGDLIIHRIVSIKETEVITKGDANNTEDDPIDVSRIKGKKVARFQSVGTIVSGLRSNVGFFLILVMAIILFELPYYKERKRVVEEQEKIKEEIRKLREE
jgi:signal peptidase